MSTSLLTIPVDSDAARAFESAAPEVRKSIEIMLNLRLQELVSRRSVSLRGAMDRLGQEAQSNGLTPEILESILDLSAVQIDDDGGSESAVSTMETSI